MMNQPSEVEGADDVPADGQSFPDDSQVIGQVIGDILPEFRFFMRGFPVMMMFAMRKQHTGESGEHQMPRMFPDIMPLLTHLLFLLVGLYTKLMFSCDQLL